MPDNEPSTRVTRRGLLAGAGAVTALGAAGVVGVETGVLPGRSWAYGRLGLDGPDGVVPDVEAGPVTTGTFTSAARNGAECGWAVARPPGGSAEDARGLPVVVVLHGRGHDHSTAFDQERLGLDRFLADAVAHDIPPFALASVDGGETYWHARSDGDDPAAMVVDELLPMLARTGLDTGRIGLLGWSMGGFGALHLATVLGRERVAAVGALSPALWKEYDAAAPGAFDGEVDFSEVTVFGREDALDGIALRVDCGQGDPFHDNARDYVDGFSNRPAGSFERGDHDLGYWRRVVPHQLAFLGRALADR